MCAARRESESYLYIKDSQKKGRKQAGAQAPFDAYVCMLWGICA